MREIFHGPGGRDWPLILLFAAIHLILLFNALFHEPGIGYDARGHLVYIESFSEFWLPSPSQTVEYFSPPLPYVLPATLRHYGLGLREAAKAAQLFNVAWSVILTLLLLRLCEEMRPGDRRHKLVALVLLGMLPVYYRSFAFVRGEPMLAALCVLVVHRTLRLARPGGATARNALTLGLALGCMLLSRQWGFFLLPAVVLFLGLQMLRRTAGRGRLAAAAAGALATGALVGGWFYVILLLDYGRITAFNRPDDAPFSLSNQPATFYVGTGGGALLTRPIRGAFSREFLPILYSDVWGDYWCYFVVYGRRLADGALVSGPLLEQAAADPGAQSTLQTNLPGIARYLGRNNLVSIPPALLMTGGLGLGALYACRLARRRDESPNVTAGALLALAVLGTMAGYLWFLITIPMQGTGDTIKGTYVLQIFPFVALLGAELFVVIRRRHEMAAVVVATALAVAAAHNLPVLFTRMIF